MDHPLKTYWRLYGGSYALLNSPYLFWSAILAIVCWPLWTASEKAPWSDITISVMPNLMGFSFAGMAVFLAFSDSNTLQAITQKGRTDSYFASTVANLFHFMLVQIFALVMAIVGRAYPKMVLPFPGYPFSFVGTWALLYAIFVGIAAAGQLLNTAVIINKATWSRGHSEKPIDGGERQGQPDQNR